MKRTFVLYLAAVLFLTNQGIAANYPDYSNSEIETSDENSDPVYQLVKNGKKVVVLLDLGSDFKKAFESKGKTIKNLEQGIANEFLEKHGVTAKLFSRDMSNITNKTFIRFMTSKGIYNDPVLDKEFIPLKSYKEVANRFADLYIHFIRDAESNGAKLSACSKEYGLLALEFERGSKSRAHSDELKRRQAINDEKCDRLASYYTKEKYAIARRMKKKK